MLKNHFKNLKKMSLAKLKAKETKGKHKQLPKLKTILANPIKKRCPTLDDHELNVLYDILKSSIDSCAVEPTKYATNNRICLGLESSLRCINNCQSSCVFISMSIKPIHIVSLISRNAEVKDPTQPVFAQPHLEDFIEKLFGIRALCMVLPKDIQGINENLCTWVERRRKPKVENEKEQHVSKCGKNRRKPKHSKVSMLEREVISHEATDKLAVNNTEKKSLVGDFISFGADVGDLHMKDDKNEALNALTQMISKIPKQPIIKKEDTLPMQVDDVKTEMPEEQLEGSEDSIDFLDNYKPLTVHKIKLNPNKKPKKKRNKNKNKNPKM